MLDATTCGYLRRLSPVYIYGSHKGKRSYNQGILDICTHFKPTETFQYTHFSSCHPAGVRKGLIKGEALRLLRTENTCVEESLDNSEVRSVYLVTHSQADIVKFASREDFAQAIVTAFSQGKAKVVHWCCCREQHKKSGEHYHLSLKLDRNQRWLNAKRYLLREYSISVHFSSKHHNYYSAWRYVTKCDNNFIESAGHPYLGKNSEPPTSSASRARHSKKR